MAIAYFQNCCCSGDDRAPQRGLWEATREEAQLAQAALPGSARFPYEVEGKGQGFVEESAATTAREATTVSLGDESISERSSPAGACPADLFKEFMDGAVRPVVQGRPCTFITEDGERQRGAYRLGKGLQHLVLHRGEAAKGTVTTGTRLSLKSISEAYTLDADGVDFFSRSITKAISSKEQLCLLKLAYSKESEPRSVCLLAATRSDRDTLLKILQVLHLYHMKAETAESCDPDAASG